MESSAPNSSEQRDAPPSYQAVIEQELPIYTSVIMSPVELKIASEQQVRIAIPEIYNNTLNIRRESARKRDESSSVQLCLGWFYTLVMFALCVTIFAI